MHHDAVEIHDRPDRFERSRPPGGHFRVEIGGDFRDQRGRNLHAVQLTHDLLDVAGGHPLGVQGQDLLVEARHAPLVLADQLRLERAVAIAGRGDGQLAQVALHRLLRTPVATVRRALARARRRRSARGAPASGDSTPAADGNVLRPRWTSISLLSIRSKARLHHQPHQTVEVLGRLGLAGDLTC